MPSISSKGRRLFSIIHQIHEQLMINAATQLILRNSGSLSKVAEKSFAQDGPVFEKCSKPELIYKIKIQRRVASPPKETWRLLSKYGRCEG
jgi:hypothetical protein